jgi:hypothetical protein
MKYAPGLMVGQLSGSTGSTVASHNKFGSYFRSRTIPVNPNSAAQLDVRNLFAEITQQWRNMTGEEILAWNAAALNVTLYDALGVAYTPTGHQFHQSINTGVRIYNPAAALLTEPPAPAPPAGLLTITPALAKAGAKTVAYTATPLGAGVKAVIETTRSISAGRTYIGRSEYKQTLITAAAAASPADIDAGYTSIYGEPEVGLKVGVRVFLLQADGQRSAPVSAVAIVT